MTMLVNDRLEIGTLECRLSSKHCGYSLNRDERSFSVGTVKPNHIRSRGSRKLSSILNYLATHYLGAAGTTVFYLVVILHWVTSYLVGNKSLFTIRTSDGN